MTIPSLLRILLLLLLAGCFLAPALAEPLDVWHWRSPRLTAAPMSAVASGGGRYVAVGDQGRIALSDDGTHWHAVESPTLGSLRAVTWAEGQWMAVGDHGEIVTSLDGQRWTRQDAGVFFHLRGVTRGNGLWVAVGDDTVILTSPDGRDWTQRTSGSEPLRTVLWAEGVFVAGGGAEPEGESQGRFTETHPALLLTSNDGLQWSRIPVLASGPVTALAHGAGRFVSVTATGGALTSEDGEFWRSVLVDPTSWFQPELLAIAHEGSRFVVIHSARFGLLNQVWASPDGLTWTSLTVSGLDYGYNYSGIAPGPQGWVAVGGSIDRPFAPTPEGMIVHSPDGNAWQSVDGNPGGWIESRDQLAFAGGWFFRGDSSFDPYSQTEQTILQVSSTGRQWERRQISADTYYSLPAFGRGRFVCVGRDGRMITSTDAIRWEPLASGVAQGLICVAYSEPEGRFVVGGEAGMVLSSSDGLHWKALPVPTTNAVVMVASFQGRIVAGCSRHSVSAAPFPLADTLHVLSSDGVWTGPVQESPEDIHGLGAWEEGFHAVVGGRLLHSRDGTVWTPDSIMDSGATVPTSGGGKLLVFRLGSTSFFERGAGETAWRMHELPWRVRRGNSTFYAPARAAYGHGTFLLAHGDRSLLQSEPLQPTAPRADPDPTPAIPEGVGFPVTFEASTLGSEPMAYQWRLNGVDLPGATTPFLTLRSLEGTQLDYTCSVTNALGAAVIGPFRVVAAEGARLDLPIHGLGVRLRGTAGARYRLEVSEDLRSWVRFRDLDLTTEGEATSATGVEPPQFPGVPAANQTRFFRARFLR